MWLAYFSVAVFLGIGAYFVVWVSYIRRIDDWESVYGTSLLIYIGTAAAVLSFVWYVR